MPKNLSKLEPKESPPVSPTSIGELLLAFRRKINTCTKKGPFEQELTFSQIELLMFIGIDSKKSMESLANHLKVAPPSVTSMIAKMERKGLVVRRKDKVDRRVIYIELSPKTKKQVMSLWKEKELVLKKVVSKLTKTDKDHFIRIMQTLISD